MTVTYRYYVYTLGASPRFVAEIPLKNVEYGNGLYTAYELSGEIAVVPQTEPFNVREYTRPGKYALYVMRNSECVWGGIFWTRSYSSVDKTLAITAMTFEAAFYARIWRRTRTYADNTSQYEIARTLLNDILTDYDKYTPKTNWTGITKGSPSSGGCPGQPPGSAYTIGNCYVTPLVANADIGLTIPGPPSGVNEKDPKFLTKETDGFLGYDMKNFGSVLEEFARSPREPDKVTDPHEVGFEYRINCVWDENTKTFRREFEFGYPKIRDDKSTLDDVYFDYPGSIREFSYEESAEDSAVRAWASGAGQGNEKIAQVRYSSARIREGFLLTERVDTHSDVEQPSILYGLATSSLMRNKTPRPGWSFTVAGWEYPRFMTPIGDPGSWRIGDWVQFVIRDEFYHGLAGGSDSRGIYPVIARIVGYTVTLEGEENEQPSEIVSLEIEGAVVGDALPGSWDWTYQDLRDQSTDPDYGRVLRARSSFYDLLYNPII
jgi:hypothetical protein